MSRSENPGRGSQLDQFWARAHDLVAAGDYRQAISLLEGAMEATPDDVSVKRALADLYLRSDQVEAALVLIEELTELFPRDHTLLMALGQMYQHLSIKRYADARAVFEDVLRDNPGDFAARVELAKTCSATFDLHAARTHFLRAIELRPDDAEAHLHLGAVYRDLGDMDAADNHFRRAIQLDRYCSEAYRNLAHLRRQSDRDDFLRAMETLYDEKDLSTDQRVDLAFALGKAFDDLDDTDRAFRFWREGNRLKRETLNFSTEDVDVFFRHVEAECDSEFFDRAIEGCDDRSPIFVVGMFRTGTSLVHQILASHSDVYGAGEQPYLDEVCRTANESRYPDYVKTLDEERFAALGNNYVDKIRAAMGDETRFVDKMPQNFQFLGLISKILPNAKIVHCMRDPMDTCFSIYKNFFGGRHSWTWDQREIGAVYSSYRRLMLHWNKHMSDNIHVVRYENLVNDTERETQRMLDYCGLQFEPTCLEFWKSKATISTASASQVRRGIYSDSIRGWRRYENELQPLVASLE